MTTTSHRATGLVTALAVAAASVSPVLAQGATPASSGLAQSDYRACQATSDDQFRAAIESITRKALSRGVAKIDYGAVVRDEWRKGDLDRIIDERVDAATESVRSESSWGSLLQSLASRDKANELATAIAERVYRSEPVKQAITGLATGVGEQIGAAIVITTADAAGPAQTCVRLFLGDRYGSTVAGSVSRDAGAAFEVEGDAGAAGVKTSTLLKESAYGISGAVILLVRRQLARMAGRLGQRLVGSVLSRLVSVVAGGIGVALIAKDIWDFRHGMLPIIAEEMKSPQTKAKVQQELAQSIETQIKAQTRQIARETSQRILKIWKDFQRAHNKVLDLAESKPAFRKYLDVVGDENLPKLDEIVALILAEGGDPAVESALETGRLQRAVQTLSPQGLRIGRETRSLKTAMDWTTLASDRLPRVVELGLHNRAKPQDFSATTLQRLLNLQDRLAILRLTALPQRARDALFELDNARLRLLSRSLTETELSALSDYIGGLEPEAQKHVLEQVSAAPARMQRLASSSVRDAVIASRDQTYAVEMLLRETGTFDIDSIFKDIEATWDGRVHPRLMWDRHPILVITGAIVLLLLLLMLRSVLFAGRRNRPVAAGQTGSGTTA